MLEYTNLSKNAFPHIDDIGYSVCCCVVARYWLGRCNANTSTLTDRWCAIDWFNGRGRPL